MKLETSGLPICESVANRSVFVLGFARSKTTIVNNIINSTPSAYVLGEANFYMGHEGTDFRARYNAQHRGFRNQLCKSTYAADFLGRDGPWWEWLEAAAARCDLVGDKMAFAASHFSVMPPGDIRKFFELRFFPSRYLFLFRDPLSTLLSTFRLAPSTGLASQIDAWCQFVQLWADWIRVFPNTLSLVCDELGEAEIESIGRFLSIRLDEAGSLLDASEVRAHDRENLPQPLADVAGDLLAIYEQVGLAIRSPRAVWQVEQKVSVVENDTRRQPGAATLVAPRPLGQAWALASALRERLATRN